jgi:hypothetical protein
MVLSALMVRVGGRPVRRVGHHPDQIDAMMVGRRRSRPAGRRSRWIFSASTNAPDRLGHSHELVAAVDQDGVSIRRTLGDLAADRELVADV